MWILELRYRFYAGAVACELNESDDFAARSADHLEARVSRLEEIIFARWPRSVVLRRRLARELREVDATWAESASDFRGRRIEWATAEIITSSLRFAARSRGERKGKR